MRLLYLLKIAFYVVRNCVLGAESVFSVLSEDGAPWFLLALSVFILLSYAFRENDPKYYYGD